MNFPLTSANYRINVEGGEAPLPFSTLLEHPELRHIGSNQR
jgi:phosphatidylinositol 3-kinase